MLAKPLQVRFLVLIVFEIKTKNLTWSGFASMSITVDTAIRIVLHSAEVVQLYPKGAKP